MKCKFKIAPLLLLVTAILVYSDILYVGPGGYPTIQHGLNAASTGDQSLGG